MKALSQAGGCGRLERLARGGLDRPAAPSCTALRWAVEGQGGHGCYNPRVQLGVSLALAIHCDGADSRS